MLRGYIAAVVTPFKNGKLDLASFESYINSIISSGVSGIAVCGSTGESLSLSLAEKIELIRAASTINKGRVKLIAGVIDSVTSNCVELIKTVEDNVDAFLCICPYYIKPSQNQIFEHFKILSNSSAKDIILYNNPGRVGTSIGFETFKRLCYIQNIVAIKECTSDLSVFSLWRNAIKRNFNLLSGNDDSACAALAMGASGVISVTANVAPKLCVSMYKAFCEKNLEKFAILRDMLAPLHELMFAEPSPGPVKYVLSKTGLIKNELRMPLSPISDTLCKKIDVIIEKLENI